MMFRNLLAHGSIIIALMYVVFFFIDRVNPVMSFIDNDITKVLLMVLSGLSITNAIQVIAGVRRKKWERLRRKHSSRKK